MYFMMVARISGLHEPFAWAPFDFFGDEAADFAGALPFLFAGVEGEGEWEGETEGFSSSLLNPQVAGSWVSGESMIDGGKSLGGGRNVEMDKR